jgi:hypothetical protein
VPDEQEIPFSKIVSTLSGPLISIFWSELRISCETIRSALHPFAASPAYARTESNQTSLCGTSSYRNLGKLASVLLERF